MGEWMAIVQWQDCARLARPGIVFELRNAEGRTMLSPCTVRAPKPPLDWTSPPVEFRAVAEPPAEHSAPIPAPRER
jgi:hypothetical protein